MRIYRPSSDELVLIRPRLGALVRLMICVLIVAGFYCVLLVESAQSAAQAVHAHWLLLMVPVFLLPYLLDSIRVLAQGESHVFDTRLAELRAARQVAVPFADIHHIELRAVNGSCEELTLSARLLDGQRIVLMTDGATSRVASLATEIAAMVGVELRRQY